MDIGDSVQHVNLPEWGTGTIRKLSASKATVFFPELATEKTLLLEFLRTSQPTSGTRDKAFAHLNAVCPREMTPVERPFEVGGKVWNGWVLAFKPGGLPDADAFVAENSRAFSLLNTRCFKGHFELDVDWVCIVPGLPQVAIVEYAQIGMPKSDGELRVMQARLAEVSAMCPFEIISVGNDHVEAKFNSILNDTSLARTVRKLLPRCSDDQSENRLQADDLIEENGFCLNWWD